MTISLPPKGNDAKVLGAYFSPLKVEALATPGMFVKVAEGAFWTADNEHQEFIGGVSPQISAIQSGAAKWVLLTVTPNGALNLIDGVSGSNPALPDISLYKDELPLAAIFVSSTTTTITNDTIYDIRPMWQIPPDSVSQTQLNDFATITFVNNGLATKAETDGTGSANFTLNVGGGSINDSGIVIDRQAGPDVAIRFNELATSGSPAVSDPHWEFTNNGITWQPIGVDSLSGDYFTAADLTGGALDFLYYTQTALTGVSGAGVLDSRYYEQADADAAFATIVHTHVTADITDLAAQVETVNLIAPVSGDVSLNVNDILDVRNVGPAASHALVWDTVNTEYRNRQLKTNDLEDVDTATVAPVAGDVIIHSGGLFTNRQLLKTDISDFLGTEFMLLTNVAGDAPVGDGPPDSNGVSQDVYGLKTFKDGIVIETSLVVTGGNASINTTHLTVTDPFLHINDGELGDGVDNGTGTAGLTINRGFTVGSPNAANPPAIIQWDESAGQWEIGVEGNLGQVLTGAHTHISGEILDFTARTTIELAVNDLDTIQDVTYLTAPVTGNHLVFNFGTGQWENSVFATDVTTELNANNLQEMQDVSYVGVSVGDFLRHDGGIWTNHLLVKADIDDFTETDYIHTTGDETKVGNLTIDGNFITTAGIGSETRLKSEHVYITDTVITLNADETVDGGGGSLVAGLEVKRGPTYQNALIRWDESGGGFFITEGTGATLTTSQIETVGHTHSLVDVTDVSASAVELNYSTGLSSNVQAQLNGKISRTGDVMDNGANLTFAVTGEVLGLPAVPSATGAASKEYVESLTGTHASDMDVHLSSDQNTFLDGLTLGGSPGPLLTASDVNNLIGISGNVQTLLDLKANRVLAAHTTGTIAALDVNGDLVDSNVIVNDAVSATTTIWTSAEIDIRKPNKVVPAITGNLAGLSLPNGDLVDSGLILNDGGILVTEIWSAQKIDGAKADKIAPAATNNLASLDVGGNLQDAGALINDAAGPDTGTMWTSNKINADYSTVAVPILANSIATLDGTGNLVSSEKAINDAVNTTAALWTANKIDTTKMDKVGTAVVGNFAEFGIGGIVEDNGNNTSTFAAAAHTHVVADVTDFNAGVNTYITTLALLGDISDVSVTPNANDILVRNGGNTAWEGQSAFTIFGTDFVRSSGSIAESITGVKTFNDDVAVGGNIVVTGDLTVNGTTTTIDTANLEVSDKNITVNAGYSGATSGSTGSGLHVNRNQTAGSPPVLDLAALIWDDALLKWKGGLEGSEEVLATEGSSVAQPLWIIEQAPAQPGSPVLPKVVYSITWGGGGQVPAPTAGKTGLQVFVNGVKQIEGAGKTYTVNYATPSVTVVTFTSTGAAPTIGADVEFYGFGYIA